MADCLRAVPMSRSDTGAVTLAALGDTGARCEPGSRRWPTWTPSTTSTRSGRHARPRAGSRGPPGRRWLTCSVISTTARSTVNDAGSATTTAVWTGCRCAAGWAAATPTSGSTTPWSGCATGRRSTWVAALGVWWPIWSSAACPRWASTSRPPPSNWPVAAAPRHCAATCSNRCPGPAGGRRCCWPTATSASAVTRGACCAGRANCCAAADGVWPNSTRRSAASTRDGCGWSRRARSARGFGGRRSASTARHGWPTTSALRSRRSTRSAGRVVASLAAT